MKKIAITLVAILSVAVMALAFAGCGVSGTYKFESATIGNKTYEVGDEMLNTKLEKDSFILVLNGDGTCSFKSGESEEEVKGKWEEKEDGKITFTSETVGIPFSSATRDGSRLTFDLEGVKITLKK